MRFMPADNLQVTDMTSTTERDLVLCLCTGPFNFKNMAIRQRILYLADNFDLELVCMDVGNMGPELASRRAKVRQFPGSFKSHYWNSLAFLLWAALLSIRLCWKSHKKFSFVYSFHDCTLPLGRIARIYNGSRCKWICDVLDDPGLELNNWKARRIFTLRERAILFALIVWNRYVRHVLSKVDLAIVQGTDTHDSLPTLLHTQFGVPYDSMLCVPNGIDLELIKPSGCKPSSTPQFRIFYVGYVSELRGLGTVMKAFQTFARQFPEARLDLVGWTKPRDQEWLERVVEESGLATQVRYHGVQDSETVWRMVEESAVCIFPFEREELSYVFPVKVFEYLALESPVIATRLEGVSKIIQDGENGLLVPAGDVVAWTRAFRRIRTDKPLRRRMKAVARLGIRRFSWRHINGRVIRAMQRLSEDFEIEQGELKAA